LSPQWFFFFSFLIGAFRDLLFFLMPHTPFPRDLRVRGPFCVWQPCRPFFLTCVFFSPSWEFPNYAIFFPKLLFYVLWPVSFLLEKTAIDSFSPSASFSSTKNHARAFACGDPSVPFFLPFFFPGIVTRAPPFPPPLHPDFFFFSARALTCAFGARALFFECLAIDSFFLSKICRFLSFFCRHSRAEPLPQVFDQVLCVFSSLLPPLLQKLAGPQADS